MLFWWLSEGGASGAQDEYYLRQTGIDRVPGQDPRQRRVIDALGRIRLYGMIPGAGSLSLAEPTTPEDGVRGGVFRTPAISSLGLTVSDPPTQAEMQQVVDKLNEILGALRVSGVIGT